MSEEYKENTGLTLEFQFLAGQYHATQWGRNVNEGLIDWPPSPWRILRAVISAWKTHASEIEDSKVRPIIENMCKSHVSFEIPKAIQAHTRHYMPIKKSTEKVIDSFVMTDKGECLYAHWNDLKLEEEQKEILGRITDKIKYLGRAESWCKVRITDKGINPNCVLLEGDNFKNKDIIEVITPASDSTLDDLCMRVSDMHENKKSHPDKSKFVQYVREPDCLTHVPTNNANTDTGVKIVRYVITGSVRPKITETVRVADIIKRAAMSVYGQNNNKEISETLSGKDSNKEMLKGHSHAFYLPTDEDNDNILDHVTIFAKAPFDEKELGALNIMNKIRYSPNPFEVIYESRGNLKDFAEIPILESSKKWETVTPFVLNKHTKFRGSNGEIVVDGPEDQLRDEIRNRFGDEIKVKSLKIDGAKIRMRTGIMPIQFKRWRKDRLPGFGAYNVKIEFDKDMTGPLSFGHGSHFGLGLLVPSR